MSKELRQRAILELIGQEDIASQETLRERLIEIGFNATQATLSRDLKELNVVKTNDERGSYKYTILDNWAGLPILGCEVSGNLMVVRTETGMAAAVAYKVDEMELPEILGTVAGEDTLLVVVAEHRDTRKVKKELWKRIQAL